MGQAGVILVAVVVQPEQDSECQCKSNHLDQQHMQIRHVNDPVVGMASACLVITGAAPVNAEAFAYQKTHEQDERLDLPQYTPHQFQRLK